MRNEIGKVVIVTGAGQGIGRAIAEKYLRAECIVLAIEKRPELLETFLVKNEAAGARVAGMVADVTDRAAPAAIFSRCREVFGQVNILVNNAGVGNAKEALLTSDDDLDYYIDTNMMGTFRMCRRAVEEMVPGGAVVNIASVFGIIGFRGSSGYSAAKAGVIGLTRQFAADYGPRGLRFNAVAPGLIVTEATMERVQTNKWLMYAMVETAPLGKPGKPEDVAEAVFFLGSDAARYISAVVLPVDAGWTGTRFYPDL